MTEPSMRQKLRSAAVASVLSRTGDVSSQGRADLARLRLAVSQPFGRVPMADRVVVRALSSAGFTVNGDKPTRAENAMRAALTLHAVHQQSKSKPMHSDGVGLGTAMLRLAPHDRHQRRAAVVRRFEALVQSYSVDPLAYQLRQLVGQLRSEGIPLDYGQLFLDLYDWDYPGARTGVLRRWSLQFAKDHGEHHHTDQTNNTTQES